MNEKVGRRHLELGEYCGSTDFKSRTWEVFKVENPLAQVKDEESEGKEIPDVCMINPHEEEEEVEFSELLDGWQHQPLFKL